MDEKQIVESYNFIANFHERFLKKFGVKLPRLYSSGGKKFTKDSLTLVYLAQGYPKTRQVSKTELTRFMRTFYPDVNDVQQPRHLGAQKGWYILSGTRDDIALGVKPGHYQLYNLEELYPAFHGHRVSDTGDWEEIKEQYDFRCATCGSREGEPNFNWPSTKTKLQKAHMDPGKPLQPGNIIPQCQKCNRADRNRWVYDQRGRVIRLANPSVIQSSSPDVRLGAYKILFREFKGKDPDDHKK